MKFLLEVFLLFQTTLVFGIGVESSTLSHGDFYESREHRNYFENAKTHPEVKAHDDILILEIDPADPENESDSFLQSFIIFLFPSSSLQVSFQPFFFNDEDIDLKERPPSGCFA